MQDFATIQRLVISKLLVITRGYSPLNPKDVSHTVRHPRYGGLGLAPVRAKLAKHRGSPGWFLLGFQGLGGAENVGKMLGKCWENVGKMLGNCWENVGKMVGKCWENGTPGANSWDYFLWNKSGKKCVGTIFYELFFGLEVYYAPVN